MSKNPALDCFVGHSPPRNDGRVVAILLYFVFLLCIAPINLLSFDTYYYWEWSRHLALSYYDGSPMIAYFMKAATLLFGNTLFALSFVGVFTTALSSFILYQTARLVLTREASLIATSLWLFAPLVTLTLLKQTTYDAPLTLFWTLTLYFTTRFIPTPQPKFLYAIGLSAGLLLLSKYSGIVLLLGLLIFLAITPYRRLFKSPHFYASLALTLLLFSPVLWWNFQHDFISFNYQLTSHQVTQETYPLWNALASIVTIFIPALNFLLIPPFYYLRTQKTPWHLWSVISFTCLEFYLLASIFSTIRPYWLEPFLITAALLGGAMYEECKRYQKFIRQLITLTLIISLGILITNTTQFSIKKRQAFINYQLLQAFNAKYPDFHSAVVSTGWLNARMFFFLKNKPPVYTVSCGLPENQYQFWRKKLDSAVYIDTQDSIACIRPYFKTCKQQPSVFYRSHPLYIYYCKS